MDETYEVPVKLKEAIRDGRCIAFVGAGFAGAAQLPTWTNLLTSLARRQGVNDALREHVIMRLQENRADRNEEAAQMLHDALGRDAFIAGLREELCGKERPVAMQERLNLLTGIPFRAVLTTNFDDLLRGRLSDAEAYRSVMRAEAQSSLLTNLARTQEPVVVKLHGDLEFPKSVVISRLDYRRRLYTQLGYLQFLRAVFLNYTILYLGFSFTDAYLNELRSEALAVLGGERSEVSAYAVANDVPEPTRRHFAKHEGIEILGYDTVDGGHEGFDRWLRAIYETTNPVVQFGRLLRGKRLLWVDPRPKSVEHLAQGFFVNAARQAGNEGCRIDSVNDAETALATLKSAGMDDRYDLVISHWGYSPSGESTAERLLLGIRRDDNIRVPTLIFSTPEHAAERKPIALGLGAHGYYFTNDGLIRAIERIFTPGDETG